MDIGASGIGNGAASGRALEDGFAMFVPGPARAAALLRSSGSLGRCIAGSQIASEAFARAKC